MIRKETDRLGITGIYLQSGVGNKVGRADTCFKAWFRKDTCNSSLVQGSLFFSLYRKTKFGFNYQVFIMHTSLVPIPNPSPTERTQYKP